jgi:FkbM family methyltransferase
MFKRMTRKVLRGMGLEIQRSNKSTLRAAMMRRLLAYHQVDLVFDVGASHGQYALGLRENGYAGRVVSFEPQSDMQARMAVLAKSDPRWDVLPPIAIGSNEGETEINISSNSYSSSVLPMLDRHVEVAPHSAYVRSERVRLARLDVVGTPYLTADVKSPFLKMDVQGFEKEVLEGARGIIPRLRGIHCELTLVPLYKGQPLYREMLDVLTGFGFALHCVFQGFTDMKSGRMLQMDGIFFREDAATPAGRAQ